MARILNGSTFGWYTKNHELINGSDYFDEIAPWVDISTFKREYNYDTEKFGKTVNTHVQMIMITPQKFGITQNEVDAIEKEYGAYISNWGNYNDHTKSREELMILAMKRGNIRIREVGGNITLNIYDFDKNKDILQEFLLKYGNGARFKILSAVGDVRDGEYSGSYSELMNSFKKKGLFSKVSFRK